MAAPIALAIVDAVVYDASLHPDISSRQCSQFCWYFSIINDIIVVLILLWYMFWNFSAKVQFTAVNSAQKAVHRHGVGRCISLFALCRLWIFCVPILWQIIDILSAYLSHSMTFWNSLPLSLFSLATEDQSRPVRWNRFTEICMLYHSIYLFLDNSHRQPSVHIRELALRYSVVL